MEVLLILWFVCGIASGVIGSQKGYSGCGFFLLGICTGLIGLAVAMIVPKRTGA
jgi:hypothetical protein